MVPGLVGGELVILVHVPACAVMEKRRRKPSPAALRVQAGRGHGAKPGPLLLSGRKSGGGEAWRTMA